MNDENKIQFLNDEAEDDAYCKQLLQDYLNDPDPHKHDSVSLEEAMELCGVTASEIEALEELEYMEKHPEEHKSYESVDEMFKDILGDEWDPDYTNNNIMKAVRNAEYLAEIDKAAAQFEAGKGQIHDLIEVEDDE